MIRIIKNLEKVPSILKNKKREEAFKENVKVCDFKYGKTLYKPNDVKDKLYTIYNKKCAYCEKDISDDPKAIEHYRPKDIYYWLAYSWDNLLLSCTRCNSKKGTKFPTQKKQVIYTKEKFQDIHSLGNSYDILEQPKMINPEKEDIQAKLIFKRDGRISSEDERITYNIEEVYNLNRDELVQNRVNIFNDLNNLITEFFFQEKKDKKIFNILIDDFISKSKKENIYFAFREFILKNPNVFFNDFISNIIDERYIKHIQKDEK